MLSKRASYEDNIPWWWQTTGEFEDPEGMHPKAQHHKPDLSIHLSKSKTVHLETVPTSQVHLQSPGAGGLLLTKFQSHPGFTKFGADLPLFKMRIFWLNTTWDSQSPGTTITSTTEVNASLSPPEAYSTPGVEDPLPLWVCSSLSTPGSVRTELPPNAVIAIWVSMHAHSKIIIVTSLLNTSNMPSSVWSTQNTPSHLIVTRTL